MTSIGIKKAVAAYRATEAEICPHAEQGEQRSAWFKEQYERLGTAKEAMDVLIGVELAKRGVRLRTDGCGCCDSPHLTLFLDDEFIYDEGNWYFDNLEGREVPK